jgi:AI-2 transport protein TqsA
MPQYVGEPAANRSGITHATPATRHGDGAGGARAPVLPAGAVLVYAAAAGLTTLAVYLMIVGKSILLPFVIGVFVWYLVNALASVSRRIRIRGRSLPASLRFGVAIVMLVVLTWLVIGLVLRNIDQVVSAAPRYEQNLLQLTNRLGGVMGFDEVPHLLAWFEGVRLTSFLRSLAGALTYLAGSVGTVAVYVTFLLLEQHSFNSKIAALFPDAAREARVHRILERIGDEIQTYVWLKTVMSLLPALASYVVMKSVGLDLAEFWALLIFAMNYIPYIGAWLGVIFPTLLAAVQFGTLGPVLATAGALAVVQFTTGSILEPRIMGKGLNLSPVVMLLSLAFWGTIWGVVGMFMAVPLMVVIMIVCSHVEGTRSIAVLMSADGELRT